MITEVSLKTGRTRTPSTICLWNHSTMFPLSAPASPGSRWHRHLWKPPDISQEEPGPERQSFCFKTSAEVLGEAAATAVRLTAEEIPHSQKQPSLLLRASPGCCLPCWQHLLGCHSLARLSASCVSEQEQQARSHCKCLLEMERPGPVAAAAPFPARAVQRLRGSRFTGDMGRMAHERASQAEPGAASQTKNICASYLGKWTERSKGGLNQTHILIPCWSTKPTYLPGLTYPLLFEQEWCSNIANPWCQPGPRASSLISSSILKEKYNYPALQLRGIRLRKLLEEILSENSPQSLDSNPNSLGSEDRDLATLQDPLVHTFPAGLVQGLLTWMSNTYLPPPSHLFCFKESHASLPGLISP